MKILVRTYLIIAVPAFIFLAYLANQIPYFSWDLQISRTVQQVSFSPLISLFTWLTNLGYGPTVTYWIGGLVVLLFLVRKKLESLTIVFIAALESVFFFSLTRIVHRSRPSPDLIHVVNHLGISGFPSGHVMTYSMVFGFLLYLSLKIPNRYLKWLAVFFCSSVIVLIGIARIYSGEHWPSDILGAYLLGSIGLIIAIYLYQWSKRKFSR